MPRALISSRLRLSARWTPINASRRLPRWPAQKDVARARRDLGRQGRNACCQGLSRRQEAHSDVRRSRRAEVWRLRQRAVADPLRRIQSQRSVGMNRNLPGRNEPTGPRPPQPSRRTIGKRKRPPSRRRSGSPFFVWRLKESHFRESLSSVLAPFRRADFLCPAEAKTCSHTPQRRPLGGDR